MFGRGLGREKAESAWVDGVDYWSKMKGSRGKNKMGKLHTHFGSAAHASALQNYLHFVRNDKLVDMSLTKDERERMLEFENERIKDREVVEILIDIVLVLTRNDLALRGSESSDNHDDGNFCEIVNLIARHNPVMKSWLANRGKRKYGTTYMSPQNQNEFVVLLGQEIQQIIRGKVRKSGYCSVMADTTPDVSHTDQLSVAVRFVGPDSLNLEDRLICIKYCGLLKQRRCTTFDSTDSDVRLDIQYVGCL